MIITVRNIIEPEKRSAEITWHKIVKKKKTENKEKFWKKKKIRESQKLVG